MKSNKRGATILNISIAIVIILIISSTILFNVTNNFDKQNLDNLYNDIRTLKEKVELYYLKYGKLPLGKEYLDKSRLPTNILNPNDGEKYYFINLNSLENLTLNTPLSDANFIINEQSHTIYYPAGLELQGKTYYRLPEEYTKI